MATIFRAPLISRFVAPVATAALLAQAPINLLASTLAGHDQGTGAPGQTRVLDAPNPRGAIWPTDLRSWNPPLALALTSTPAVPPLVPILFANPSRISRFAMPEARRRTMANLDRVWEGPGQAPSFQPPANPLGPVFPIALRTLAVNLQQTTLLPLVAPPFVTRAWPNPLGAPFPIANRGFLGYYVEDQTVAFSVSDWPNPIPRPFPLANRTLTQTPPNQLAGGDVLPFRQVDFPLPTLAVRHLELRASTLSPDLELLGKDVLPARLLDWPNPRIAGYLISLRSFLGPVNLQTAGQDVLPNRQTQWPNPLGPIWPVSLRTHVDSRKLILRDQFFGAPGQPFQARLADNPRRPIYPQLLLSYRFGLTITFRASWATNSNHVLGPTSPTEPA